MRYVVTIDLDNDAFANGQAPAEVARILRDLAAKVELRGVGHLTALDYNGNTVAVAELHK
ncbi:MAG: hypothetical protein KGL39_20775 [Patescibacteria group bacterium]|nr:hypothetical protein [Patescibacteria group bacterium]